MKLQEIIESPNVAELLDDEQLNDIGVKVYKGWEQDEDARSEWKERMEEANNLALQVCEDKTFPWPGAANVKFPLLTIAALQFAARAYPALISGTDIVKCRTVGNDPSGEKAQRALRVSTHMSWQVLEQDEQWEEQMDRLLMALPILGTMFKKIYFDPIKGHNVSETVLPHDLVVPYYASSLDTARRVTHLIDKYDNEVVERQRQGIYLDIELPKPTLTESEGDKLRRQKHGLKSGDDTDAPRLLLEQHCFLDLDDDGYEEPYIVTVDASTKKVLRIVARFNDRDVEYADQDEIKELAQAAIGVMQEERMPFQQRMALAQEIEAKIEEIKGKSEIVSIKPRCYFEKYPFIPSPDGGFYDIGFGILLGPTNHAVDTIINQLIDAGTLNNSNSGFIGKGARIKGGDLKFKPFEWKPVDVLGGDLKSQIVPLPVNQPSAVLFNLLTLLINYGERVSSVTDMMVGETPGQNTPASTAMAALEQGMQVYSGIFKRIYRALKWEFRKLYRLNAENLDLKEYFTVLDSGVQAEILQQDYIPDSSDIVPAADPSVTSRQERILKDQQILQMAGTMPGFNTVPLVKRMLRNMEVDGIDQIYPTQINPETGQEELVIQPPPNPELELQAAEERRKSEETQAKIQKMQAEVLGQAALLEGQIGKLEAEIALTIAKAQSEGAKIDIEVMKARLAAMKERREMLEALVYAAQTDQELENDREKARSDKGLAGKSGN